MPFASAASLPASGPYAAYASAPVPTSLNSVESQGDVQSRRWRFFSHSFETIETMLLCDTSLFAGEAAT